jgi:hypothetical protein
MRSERSSFDRRDDPRTCRRLLRKADAAARAPSAKPSKRKDATEEVSLFHYRHREDFATDRQLQRPTSRSLMSGLRRLRPSVLDTIQEAEGDQSGRQAEEDAKRCSGGSTRQRRGVLRQARLHRRRVGRRLPADRREAVSQAAEGVSCPYLHLHGHINADNVAATTELGRLTRPLDMADVARAPQSERFQLRRRRSARMTWQALADARSRATNDDTPSGLLSGRPVLMGTIRRSLR